MVSSPSIEEHVSSNENVLYRLWIYHAIPIYMGLDRKCISRAIDVDWSSRLPGGSTWILFCWKHFLVFNSRHYGICCSKFHERCTIGEFLSCQCHTSPIDVNISVVIPVLHRLELQSMGDCGSLPDIQCIYRYVAWSLILISRFYEMLIVLSIISLVQSALPNATFFQQSTTNFSVPWISLTSALNILVTGLIVGRILYMGHKYGRVLSQINRHSTSPYTGLIAIIVESELPLSILGIIFSVVLKKELSIEIAIAITYGAFMVCFEVYSLTKDCYLQPCPY